jgi:hypothetical protein
MITKTKILSFIEAILNSRIWWTLCAWFFLFCSLAVLFGGVIYLGEGAHMAGQVVLRIASVCAIGVLVTLVVGWLWEILPE